MDPGDRRESTSSSPLTSWRWIALLATGVVVLQLLHVGGPIAAAPEPVDEVPGGGAPPAVAERQAAPAARVWESKRALDPVLTREIQAEVAAAVRQAEESARVPRGSARVSVHVRALSGAELVTLDAERSMLPASNMKLVTSAAALVLLGADGRLETRFESAAPIQSGHLRGDLVVRACGDPLYDAEADGEVAHLLAPVVESLLAAGIAEIDGDIVLDEGDFAAPAPGPGWPEASQHWQAHCALAGGLSANGGCLTTIVEAGRVGRGARVRVLPAANGLPRKGKVVTGKARTKLDVVVGARRSGVTVSGSIPSDVSRWSARFAYPDPVELFGHALAGALVQGGLTLHGEVVRRRGVPAARVLATLESNIIDTLAPINTESNNAVADQLFLALGHAQGHGGTREGGARATREALARLGVPASGLVQVDGSGLSRDDRVTARQVSALLAAVLSSGSSCAQSFADSLAIAGGSGTLAKRMRGTPAEGRVRAKTGWINGASALAGVVQTARNRFLVFSILVDYPRVSGLNTSCWKPMQDRICNILVGHDG